MKIFLVLEILQLLNYLIGHNNPINGFRPAATHATPVAYINRWQGCLDLVFPTNTRSSSSPTSRRSILLHTNDMAEPVQPLNINTLYNVYVVEELIQLSIESNEFYSYKFSK